MMRAGWDTVAGLITNQLSLQVLLHIYLFVPSYGECESPVSSSQGQARAPAVPQLWALGACSCVGLRRSGGFHQQRGPMASLFLLARAGLSPEVTALPHVWRAGLCQPTWKRPWGAEDTPKGTVRSRKSLSQLRAQRHPWRKAAFVFLIRSLK